MIRTVIKILKKHLDKGVEEFNQRNDMLTLVTNYGVLVRTTTPDLLPQAHLPNYEVLDWYPDYNELRLLARELITTIKGIDNSDLITVPSVEEMTKCVKGNLCANPDDPYFEETAGLLAEGIVKWLKEERPFRDGLDPFRKVAKETPYTFGIEEFQRFHDSEVSPREQAQLAFAFIDDMVEFYLSEEVMK